MRLLSALLAFASTSYAGISTQCVSSDLCFSLNIPETTVSSNNGDIFVQISAPTTYSWVSVAQGTSMSGANYFVIYTSSDGTNVTLSPRLGSGHNTPTYNSAAQMSLLEGSGVSNGVMTANIKCSNCNSWSGGSMTFSDSSTSWIWGLKSGSSLNTDSHSASISKHDNYGSVQFDSTAQGGNDANPFVAASGSSSSVCSSSSAAAATSSTIGSATTSSSGSSPTSTQNGDQHGSGNGDPNKRSAAKRRVEARSLIVARQLAARGLTAEAIVKRQTTGCTTAGSTTGSTTGATGSTTSSTSSDITTGSKGVSRSTLVSIHGVLAGFIFTLLFPFGGIMIRLMSFRGLWWIHGVVQMIGYIGYLVALGLGIYIATHPSYGEIKDTHPILGYFLAVLLFLQGPLGWLHHVAYNKYQRRTITSYLHLGIGRLIIPLGMINCALGLKLSNNTGAKLVVYAIIAAIIFVVYIICTIIGERRRAARLRGTDMAGFQKTPSLDRDTDQEELRQAQQRRSQIPLEERRSSRIEPHPQQEYYGGRI